MIHNACFIGSVHELYGQPSYKKKLKSLYILSKKCPDGHKNLDY